MQRIQVQARAVLTDELTSLPPLTTRLWLGDSESIWGGATTANERSLDESFSDSAVSRAAILLKLPTNYLERGDL